MLTRPHLQAVDDRLRALVDPDLERRLMGDNPQLFGGASPAAPSQAPSKLAIRFGVVMLCCALVAGAFFGLWARGQRPHAAGALKTTSAKRAHHWRATRTANRHHVIARSSGTPTAHAQRVTLLAIPRPHVHVAMRSSESLSATSSRLSHTRHALTAPQIKTAARPLQATVSEMVERQAETMEAMRVHQASDAASSSDTSSDGSSAADQSYPGRQISTGSIWSDTAPGNGVGVGGAVPILVGRGPMGGGGSCRRGH
jgi:hypothetical protein